jgi:uncharacterized iron-regulated protein
MLNHQEEMNHKNIFLRLEMLEENDIRFCKEIVRIKTGLENIQKGQTEWKKGRKEPQGSS